MMDQNKPARFLDTAYNALKANPGATNQILQAAAQGQPVGLKGLAAAAAQQSQQEAQKAMAALQQQGPQPNIIQKMATQGIMSQMDTGLPMAPQMGVPEEMPPQMMAGGGLVSFADGGNVLPPDVIDAIQSHFADGGEVRGYAEGDEIESIIRRAMAGGRDPKNLAQSETMKELFSQNEDDILRRALESETRADEIRRVMGLARNQAVGTAEAFDPYAGEMPIRGTGEAGPMVTRSGSSAYPYHPTPEPPQLNRPITAETADPIRTITANAYEKASKFPLGPYSEPYEVPVGPTPGKIPANAEESIYNLRARTGIPELPAPEPRINAVVGGDTDLIRNITADAYAKASRFPLGSYSEPYEVQVSPRPGVVPGATRAAPQPVSSPAPTSPGVHSMAERMGATASKYGLQGMSPSEAAAEMERLTPKQTKWIGGAADEAFNFGKFGELASKLPESVKATGRFLGKVAPYSIALDPRVMALVKANVGGAEMAGEYASESDAAKRLKELMIEHGAPDLTNVTLADKLRELGITDSGIGDVLGGLADLKSSDSNIQGLDWVAKHGLAQKVIDIEQNRARRRKEREERERQDAESENYAHGGDVRGFYDGKLIQSLTGQSEAPGMGLLKKAADFFTPDVNEAIPREEFDAARATAAQKERDMATLDRLLENYPRESAPKQDIAKPATWKPESHDGHEVVPRPRVIEEGTKVYKPFDQAKKDVPSAAVTPDSQNMGGLTALGGLGNMEQMRDLIMSLGGHKEMSPEILQKLGDLEGSARTSTILQSALGALGAGLSNPYGGRYALGKAALGALSGYQTGIKSEEDIGRKAFDVLRGYADAPEEEKTAARDKLFDIAKKSAELQSEERRQAIRAGSGLSLEDRKELAEFKAGLGPNPYQQTQIEDRLKLARDRASDNALRDIESRNKDRRANVQPELTPAEREAIIREHFAMAGVPYTAGLGSQQSAGQATGLGGGPLVLK